MKEKEEAFAFLFYFRDVFINFGCAGCSLLWAFRGGARAHWRGFCRHAPGSGTQGFRRCSPGPRAQAPQPVGSSQTGDTLVSPALAGRLAPLDHQGSPV